MNRTNDSLMLAGGALTAAGIISMIISVAFAVFMIIAMWKMFRKAGEGGWKCLIPIYGTYTYWKIGWSGGIFWLLFLGSLLMSALGMPLVQAGRTGVIIFGIIAAVWSIAALVLNIIMCIKTAHRFGKGGAFGFFLLGLLPVIGIAILGFGSADYDARRDI